MATRLTMDRFKEASFVRNVFAVTLDPAHTIDDLFEPSYWAHQAAVMHPGDRVEVTAEDGSLFAEVIITSVGRAYATVALLRAVELNSNRAPVPAESNFRIEFKGNKRLHCVIRKSDSELIKEGFQTSDQAKKWLADYELQISQVKQAA